MHPDKGPCVDGLEKLTDITIASLKEREKAVEKSLRVKGKDLSLLILGELLWKVTDMFKDFY